VIANSMVMTFYPWNMTAAVLAAVILLPTGIAPQSEELSGAWWLWRLGWIAACAICLVPFLFAFRWAERPGAPPPSGAGGMERPRAVARRRGVRLCLDVDHRRGGVSRAGRGAGDAPARNGVPGRRSDPAAREPVQPSLEPLCREPPRLASPAHIDASLADIARATELICDAERQIALAGNGAVRGQAARQVRAQQGGMACSPFHPA
jgi:hypothetical protein